MYVYLKLILIKRLLLDSIYFVNKRILNTPLIYRYALKGLITKLYNTYYSIVTVRIRSCDQI